MTNIKNPMRILVLVAAALIVLSLMPGAQFIQGFCTGSTGTVAQNGTIAAQPIIGSGKQGVSTVVEYTALIMLAILMVMALLYMVSSIVNLPGLTNTVKSEMVEIVATGIVIAIFFGGFFAVSQLSGGNSGLAFGGTNRNIFVSDCEILAGSSLSLVPPMFAANLISNLMTSFTDSAPPEIEITPMGFGGTFSPLAGLNLLPNTINYLTEITSLMIIALISVTFLLSIIYSLFPIFLYAGIVLRALPWTRAAGGIFISVFIGFYIIFPMVLYVTLNNFSSVTVKIVSNYTNQTANVVELNPGLSSSTTAAGTTSNTFIQNFGSVNSGPGLFSFFSTTFSALWVNVKNCASATAPALSCHGLINGYINTFLEPAFITLVGVVFSLIISLDFADILSDMLGAPNLTTASLLGKVL